MVVGVQLAEGRRVALQEWARGGVEGLATDPGQKHIHVINDTQAILDLLRLLLEEEGYRVTTDTFNALSLDAKKDEIAEMAPDLVVLDFIIGGEGLGWQLLQLLKMDRSTRNVPVVICTGAVKQVEELQSHLAEMGVGAVLKPFDIDRLLAEIANALDRDASGQRPATLEENHAEPRLPLDYSCTGEQGEQEKPDRGRSSV